MCGIAGALGVEIRNKALAASCERLRHRGPDGEATWREGDLGLAHTRLAIIDRAGGAQPMVSADGRYVVVFNGEIYNHGELRRELESRGIAFRTRSDTEVLLALYAFEGRSMVERLRGMFAFAIVDRSEHRALLARDRFGKKPLCFARLGRGVAFASTLDGLRPLLRGTPSIDRQALVEYLELQYVPAPRSIWEGVEKLPPGHLAEWSADGLEIRRYWSPPARDDARPLDRDETVDRLRTLVADAVTSRLESEVPIGVFLSGGLDSSVVVAELAAAGLTPATYSVGSKRAAFDESRYARLVAERFGTDHHELIADDDPLSLFDELTTAYDEPFADSSALTTLAVARAARQHVTVILTGDGGDELFAGYDRYAVYRRARRLHRRLGPLAGAAASVAVIAGRVTGRATLTTGSRWIRDPWSAYRDALLHFTPSGVSRLVPPEVLEGADADVAVLRLDAARRGRDDAVTLSWVDETTYLSEDLLVKMDRATMAHGLEARSPLLDHELASFAATLQESMLFDGDVGKALVRHAYRDVLPAAVLERPKMGFGVPLASWLRAELRPAVDQLLADPHGPLEGLVHYAEVRRLVTGLLGGDDTTRWRVWNLLALAGWLERRGRPTC
jgi:asparagine synthase (glutamine-hydrolysing)